MERSITSCSGTSLAEALVAVAVLALGLLSLAHLFVVSGAVLRRADDLSTAAMLAAQKLEELRAVAVAAEDGTVGGVELVDAAGTVLRMGDGGGGSAAPYTRRWSVQSLPLRADVRIVQVRVSPGRSDRPPPSGAAPGASEVVLVTSFARDEP